MKKIIAFLICSFILQYSMSENISLNVKVFLEGPFLIEDMIPYLNWEESIPLSQPYPGAPWYYNGDETVTVLPSTNVIDWVLVDLVILKGPIEERIFELVARKAAFILTDGSIKDVNGLSYLTVNVYTTSGLYVCIHHRNHLSVISSDPVTEAGGVYSYDFTTSAGQTLGGTHAIKELYTGIWGMFSADGNNDGQIDNLDKNEVWLSESGSTGYDVGDFNLDNYTDDSDIDYNWSVNSGKGYPFIIKHPSINISCGDSIVDIRDGLKYKTVQIGNQCWMAQNLNAGLRIDGINDMSENSVIEKYCFDDLETNCDDYGALYQWDEVMSYTTIEKSSGICPDGWHVPSDAEWKRLEGLTDSQYGLGNAQWDLTGWRGLDAGTKLKSTTGWNSGGNGTDDFGFNALPAGNLQAGDYFGLGSFGSFWTSSTIDDFSVWYRNLRYNQTKVYRNDFSFIDAVSLRCIKTQNSPPDMPSNPTPNNGAVNINIDTTLAWNCIDADEHDLIFNIYFGIASDPPLVATGLSVNSWNPGLLSTNTTFYWKIVAYDFPGDSTVGNIWSFSTVGYEFAFEDWETGDFLKHNWQNGGDQPLFITDLNPFEGNYSARSGIISDEQTSWLSISYSVSSPGNISFWYRVSSETNYDKLKFYIDDSETAVWSGFIPWTNASFPITTGLHTIKWSYSKDVSVSWGEDAAWIDNILLPGMPFQCGNPLYDLRDGQSYNTVQIGEQCWMAENLNIGNMIQGVNDMANNSVIEKYCYDNNTSNCDTYGGLYQWDEMMQYESQQEVQGICTIGWHLPSDEEWCILSQYIDPTVDCNSEYWSGIDVGNKMKSTAGWISGNGSNVSGFSALPGGIRYMSGSFIGIGGNAAFWASTFQDIYFAWTRELSSYSVSIYRRNYFDNCGYSVRCIKEDQSY